MRQRLLDGFLAVLPLVLLYLALCCLYLYQAVDRVTPTIFTDELDLTVLSRSIAESGNPARRGEPYGFPGVYPYLLAPAWWIDAVPSAFEAAKAAGVLFMAATIFPAYALARMIVSKPWAIFAAVGATATPALSYAPFLVEEPLAYPFSTLALWLIVRFVATPRVETLAAAAAVSVVAPFVRGQLVVLPAVLFLCGLAHLWRTGRARAWRATWTTGDWAGAVVLALGAVIVFSALAGHASEPWYVSTGFFKGRLVEFGFRALGALAIGIGILPLVGGLAALAPREWNDRVRAFVITTTAAIACFGLYAAVKAAYLSTVFASRTVERNLFYLVPLLFAGTALVFETRFARLWAVAAGGLIALYLVVTTPYELATYPYGDAPSLSMLALANREFIWDSHAIERALIAVVALACALVVAVVHLRGRLGLALTALTAAAVLVWSGTAEIYAARGYNASAHQLYDTLPRPPNWLDKTTHGEPAVYVGQAIDNANGIYLLEFWNRALKKVWSLDGSAPGPGPTLSPDLARTDGTLAPSPEVPYAVAENDVRLAGEKVGKPVGILQLYRLDGPLKLESAQSGVLGDGWMSSSASFTQYSAPAGGARGFVKVLLSRSGWCGPDVPGRVTVRIGDIAVKRHQPAIGRVTATKRGVLHACKGLPFLIPVRVPFRVEVRISPTFSPAELDERLSDSRQLGAQPSFEFIPLP